MGRIFEENFNSSLPSVSEGQKSASLGTSSLSSGLFHSHVALDPAAERKEEEEGWDDVKMHHARIKKNERTGDVRRG